jgi:DNA-binding response OmpR family regulator
MPATEKRILVVEDDNAIRALLLTVLRRRGLKVDTSANGADALTKLQRCVYSLVLLDLMMPVMSGYQFLEELEKMKLPDQPLIIVLTAGGTMHNLNPDVVAGTVRKPFDIELLVDTVAACLSTVDDARQSDKCPAAESEAGPKRLPEDPN